MLLIIEWVEPDDSCIKWKNHLSQPMSVVNDDKVTDIRNSLYSFEMFDLTMRRMFQCPECFQELEPQASTPSRRIFVGVHRKPPILTEADVDIGALNSKYAHIHDIFGVPKV